MSKIEITTVRYKNNTMLKKARQRLKKKLRLSKAELLFDFIKK